jgi:hypothetical protein
MEIFFFVVTDFTTIEFAEFLSFNAAIRNFTFNVGIGLR